MHSTNNEIVMVCDLVKQAVPHAPSCSLLAHMPAEEGPPTPTWVPAGSYVFGHASELQYRLCMPCLLPVKLQGGLMARLLCIVGG